MKKLLSFCILSVILISCEEKDLSVDNPPLPDENVEVAASFIYNGKGYSPDSIITNRKGNQFFLTSIKVLLSDFYAFSKGDSFKAVDSYHVFGKDNLEVLVLELPDGGYSGVYGFSLGVDSIDNMDLKPTDSKAANTDLTDTDMYRNDGNGYNSIVIEGRVINPNDPDDNYGSIPFKYEIGSLYIRRDVESGNSNFAVTADTQVNLILSVDTWPIFNDFDILTRPTITTDFSNSLDFNMAKEFSDSLHIKLF